MPVSEIISIKDILYLFHSLFVFQVRGECLLISLTELPAAKVVGYFNEVIKEVNKVMYKIELSSDINHKPIQGCQGSM